MSTEIVMRREGFHLVAVDQMGADDLQLIPSGKDLMITIRSPRNLRQFRLAWALATKVHEACDWLPDKESSMEWLKIKARHVKYLQDPRTKMVAIVPKSIAFASLSQDAFKRVFDRMVYITTTEIIPGLKESDLRREIENMVGA